MTTTTSTTITSREITNIEFLQAIDVLDHFLPSTINTRQNVLGTKMQTENPKWLAVLGIDVNINGKGERQSLITRDNNLVYLFFFLESILQCNELLCWRRRQAVHEEAQNEVD